MDKRRLEELHQQAVKDFDDYLKTKHQLEEKTLVKINEAKNEWQLAWNKLMETLLMLERLEI